MVPPVPDRPKDFTVVKRDGLYHVFYIRNNPSAAPESTQVDFGHATSPDLYFWQQQPTILPVRPGHFDRSHVWAPSIVQRDGVYYLFYTGVSDSEDVETSAQRIGVATSTDLETWNPAELPVLTGNQVPWAWSDSLESTPFRDPFVMADPTTPGRWLMYYSTAPAADSGGMVVGVATSDGDFATWRDLGPLWISDRAYSFNDVVESPHVFAHDGVWWLFFTSNSGQPISYATTTASPTAPVGQWIYHGRLANMLNLNTQAWFASEYFRDGLTDYFCFVNGDRVEFSRMSWQDDQHFYLLQPDLFHVQTLTWERPTVHADTTVLLDIQSKWGGGHTIDLESFWIDSTGIWNPVADSLLGIPPHIPVSGDTQTYQWLAKALPDSMNVPDSVAIVVRLVDQTAVAAPIWLVRQAPAVAKIDPGPDPPPEPRPQGPGLEEPDGTPQPILKTLAHGGLAQAAGVVVDLPAERRGRLDVFDLQGRRVRTLADRVLPKGASVIGWDGRDGDGLRMRRGLYFVRLTTPQESRSVRVFLR